MLRDLTDDIDSCSQIRDLLTQTPDSQTFTVTTANPHRATDVQVQARYLGGEVVAVAQPNPINRLRGRSAVSVTIRRPTGWADRLQMAPAVPLCLARMLGRAVAT